MSLTERHATCPGPGAAGRWPLALAAVAGPVGCQWWSFQPSENRRVRIGSGSKSESEPPADQDPPKQDTASLAESEASPFSGNQPILVSIS